MDKNVPSIRVQRAGDIVPLCPLAIGGHYCHTRKPAYFDSKGRLQPGASLLTRVLEYPVAILSHIGVPGFASTALHSMSDLLAMLEKEESELNGGNLLLELMDG